MRVPDDSVVCYSLTPMQKVAMQGKMLRFNTGTYVCLTFVVNQKLNFDVMRKAIQLEYDRNDCLRQRFFKEGKEWKQFFLQKCKCDEIEYIDFRKNTSVSENEYFKKISSEFIKFDAEMLSKFVLFTTVDGDSGIYIKVSHLTTDGMGVKCLIQDIFDVYFSLLYGKELPQPPSSTEKCLIEDLCKYDNKELMRENDKFFSELLDNEGEPLYNSVYGNEIYDNSKKRYLQMGIKSLLFVKGGTKTFHLSEEKYEYMKKFCEENNVSLQSLFMLGFRTYISKVNSKSEDVTITNMCHRRNTVYEKKCGGARYVGAVVRTKVGTEKTFLEALDIIEEAQYNNLRHPEYTLQDWSDLVQKKFNVALGATYYGLSFSFVDEKFLELPDEWNVHCGYYINGTWIAGIVAAVCLPNLRKKGLDFTLVYNVKKYANEKIEKFYTGSIKAIMQGIKDPNMKIGQLIDSL